MKRILITLNDDDAKWLKSEAKKRRFSVASMGRHFLLNGMQIARAINKVVLSPNQDNPIMENLPNTDFILSDNKGYVLKIQLKGLGEIFVYPPKCIAKKKNGHMIDGGVWIVKMSDPMGNYQRIIFKNSMPNIPQILRGGDELYFYFQSNEKLDPNKSTILMEIEPYNI